MRGSVILGLIVMLSLALTMLACTTTGSDGTTSTFSLNLDQINGLVSTAGNVWSIIQAAEAADDANATPSTSTATQVAEWLPVITSIASIISGLKAAPLDEDAVKAEATRLALADFKSTGRLPDCKDLALRTAKSLLQVK